MSRDRLEAIVVLGRQTVEAALANPEAARAYFLAHPRAVGDAAREVWLRRFDVAAAAAFVATLAPDLRLALAAAWAGDTGVEALAGLGVAQAPVVAGVPAEPVCVCGERILIVEDDPALRSALEECLVLEGYRTSVASNGQEALATLHAAAELPHVILLDLMMPVMNGWDFVHHLRADESLARTPVIALSAKGPSLSDPIAIDDYLTKPVDLTVLLDSVKRCC